MTRFYATVDADNMRPQWMPSDVAYLLPASSFWRRGFPRPRLPQGVEVAADCGGFVATRRWGSYRFTLDDYYLWLKKIPGLRWAAIFDQCCEPGIADSPAAIRSRQVWTRARAEEFIDAWPDVTWAWVPTLQGWSVEDYVQAADDMRPLIDELLDLYVHLANDEDADYSDEGPNPWADLSAAFRVGIGTLCARASVADIVEIVNAVRERLPYVSLHLWGVKLAALRDWPGRPPAQVVSVDSAAWNGRFGSDIARLDSDRRRLYMSQRQYGYTVQLPTYLRRFAEITRRSA